MWELSGISRLKVSPIYCGAILSKDDVVLSVVFFSSCLRQKKTQFISSRRPQPWQRPNTSAVHPPACSAPTRLQRPARPRARVAFSGHAPFLSPSPSLSLFPRRSPLWSGRDVRGPSSGSEKQQKEAAAFISSKSNCCIVKAAERAAKPRIQRFGLR